MFYVLFFVVVFVVVVLLFVFSVVVLFKYHIDIICIVQGVEFD